jgi:hypothetical protein
MKNCLALLTACSFIACTNSNTKDSNSATAPKDSNIVSAAQTVVAKAPIDTARYDQLMKYLSNGDTTGRWPAKDKPYPLAGAILPYNRIIAYYGNLYSKKMGVLGEYPKAQMLQKLKGEVQKWAKADTTVPVIPALHYICVTAQGDPGKDGKYRYRMPLSQIDTVLKWAKEINGLVFVDVQVGFSTVQDEIPLLEKYLSLPNVHLGIDPEFAMAKKGKKPGTVIGTLDAADINYTINYLADLAKKNNLPPKILVVHRFTKGMVTNSHAIKPLPEVQVVMDMDGWGNPPKKRSTYYSWIYPEPVQFTGFKLFYKNDTQRVNEKQEMQPEAVLQLRPKPVYIQYQ